MVFEFERETTRNARMKVVGVGGAGGNAVNRMIDEDLAGLDADTQLERGPAARVRGHGLGQRLHLQRRPDRTLGVVLVNTDGRQFALAVGDTHE